MSKFKKGDKVKCVEFGGDRYVVKGLVGIVMCADDRSAVQWDGLSSGHTYKGDSGWYVHPDYLVKINTFKGNK